MDEKDSLQKRLRQDSRAALANKVETTKKFAADVWPVLEMEFARESKRGYSYYEFFYDMRFFHQQVHLDKETMIVQLDQLARQPEHNITLRRSDYFLHSSVPFTQPGIKTKLMFTWDDLPQEQQTIHSCEERIVKTI